MAILRRAQQGGGVRALHGRRGGDVCLHGQHTAAVGPAFRGEDPAFSCSLCLQSRAVCSHHSPPAVQYVKVCSGSMRTCCMLLQMCTRIYRGHQNEKNFVGMSVDGEFIACGSEQNEVWVVTCTSSPVVLLVCQLVIPPSLL
jgi:hypothetical protein